MPDTYFYFVLGYMIAWGVLSVAFIWLTWKITRLEKELKTLISK